MQIMKSDEDVRMISAEAPVLFAKVPSVHLKKAQIQTQPSSTSHSNVGLVAGTHHLMMPPALDVVPVQACEMFILELTMRSWNHAEENKRRTLQRNDVAAAITRTEIFDFLVCFV